MAATLKRDLGVTSLILTVVTGTIGSGWLFAPYFCARIAGPTSLLAWVIGGVMAFLLALVFAELGALVNSSGALAQLPLLSHGRLAGFIGGWSAWISLVSLPTLEVLALLQYLSSVLPWLLSNMAFVMATWATSWSGRDALEGAVLVIALPSLIYAFSNAWRGHPIEMKSGLWWALYLGLLILDMELFSAGQPLELSMGLHLTVLAVLAMAIMPLAVNSALTEASPHALTTLTETADLTQSNGLTSSRRPGIQR